MRFQFRERVIKSEFSTISLPVFKCRQFCEQGVAPATV